MLLLFLLAVIILALGLGLIYNMLNMLEFSPPLSVAKSSYAEQGNFKTASYEVVSLLPLLSDSQEETGER